MDIIRDYSLVLIFFILPIIFILHPLFLPYFEAPDDVADIPSLRRKKLLLYRQINELEMEFDIGNINEEDFQSGRNELKQEVSEIIALLMAK
jgi:hypothetical protein